MPNQPKGIEEQTEILYCKLAYFVVIFDKKQTKLIKKALTQALTAAYELGRESVFDTLQDTIHERGETAPAPIRRIVQARLKGVMLELDRLKEQHLEAPNNPN